MLRRLAPALLSLLLPFAAVAAPATEGVDYERIEHPGTYEPVKKGEIEVAEVFAYTCHHCADLAPKIDAWKATLPKHVRVRYVPAAYDPADTLARGFFAAQEIGALGLTHGQTFRAIHDSHDLPRNPTDAELVAYYATLGADAGRMQAALDGAKVMQRMQAAKQFALRIGLQGTPTLIVDGRYRVKGRSLDDMLRIAGELVAAPPKR
jgi:thiol:disulfide interchange protein DsbA